MTPPRKPRTARWIAAVACASVVGAALPIVLSAHADPPKEGFLPDPPVTKSTKHWVFEIDVKSGVVSLGKAHPATTPKPEGTPRVMGRYAIELYSGRELLDRARFNVPGLGDGPREDKRVLKRPTMDRITTHFSVRIADNPRTNWARVVDRATGDEVYIAWPPDAPPAPVDAGDADAGAVDAGEQEPSLPPGAILTDAGFIVDPPVDAPPADGGARADAK
ncbi:MAG: hypothetical protein U0414_11070 [Polyangiaceae bacterium]